MWKELIRGFTDECEFLPPATADQIVVAESALNIKIPEHLRQLYCESDGVEGQYGLGLIWPLNRTVEDNLDFRRRESFRRIYMPFDHLLFFADAGNGDQFAFPIHADGEIHRFDVFAWNHEDDSRNWFAPSLQFYLDWWLSGKMKL